MLIDYFKQDIFKLIYTLVKLIHLKIVILYQLKLSLLKNILILDSCNQILTFLVLVDAKRTQKIFILSVNFQLNKMKIRMIYKIKGHSESSKIYK